MHFWQENTGELKITKSTLFWQLHAYNQLLNLLHLFHKAKNINSSSVVTILEVIFNEGDDAGNGKYIELVFMYKKSVADRRHQCWIIYTLMVNTVSHYLFYVRAEQSQ